MAYDYYSQLVNISIVEGEDCDSTKTNKKGDVKITGEELLKQDIQSGSNCKRFRDMRKGK